MLMIPRYYDKNLFNDTEKKYFNIPSLDHIFFDDVVEIFRKDIDYNNLWPEHGYQWYEVTAKEENNVHYRNIMNKINNDHIHYGNILYFNDKEDCVISCSVCLFNHVYPLPSDDFLEKYYKEKFYQVSKPEYEARYRQDYLWWVMSHIENIKKLQFASVGSTKSIASMLDFGCGIGIALDAAKLINSNQEGYIATSGTDMTDIYRDAIEERGHWFIDINNFEKNNKTCDYDMIYCYEVLEHIKNPEDLLLKFHDSLIEDGAICITVPNDFNTMQILSCVRYGMEPWWISPIEHLNYFTPKTLQILLRRCGFDVVSMRGTFPIDYFIFSGLNYIGNDNLGRKLHKKRMSFEMSFMEWNSFQNLERIYTNNLNEFRVGREITVIAKRRG